jgi:hypothetical protein
VREGLGLGRSFRRIAGSILAGLHGRPPRDVRVRAGSRAARFMIGDLSVECCLWLARPYSLHAVTETSTGLCFTERWYLARPRVHAHRGGHAAAFQSRARPTHRLD